MERQSIALIGFSIFFGVLVGFSILLAAFYASGTFDEDSLTAESIPTGMEILNAYQCQKAETKQILVGGVEDNFDPAGVETSNPSGKLLDYLISLEAGRSRSDVAKTYDDPSQDTHFSDRFDIPKRTFNGLIVVRLKELSRLKNDGISLGYKVDDRRPYIDYKFGYRIDVSKLPTSTEWEHHDSLAFASLKNLRIYEPTDEKQTLLDIIRMPNRIESDFFVEIADDSVVDFIGFALCLEPEDDLGTVYGITHVSQPDVTIDLGPGIVGLHLGRVDGQFCAYAGCLSCEARRPVACIKDTNMPLPEQHASYYSFVWTGGEFGFTRPVKGSKFASEDDVNQFCASELGTEWRALSRHDGHWGGSVSGEGTFPRNYENVWVNVKDSDHHNCWKPRPDYEALDDG